ncbi:uncharacterized protein LOC119082587 [Bradysia coprophila]|uniref:uncharacterized protein LOC119082587 n=1 Tax=Bradysia coprophila TaxID=38358 RepID=UPI00187D7662|nr:uncharacterized protein LOC119082587 [Bradysia coprophila]
MASWGPRKNGSPNKEFFESSESLQAVEKITLWLTKNCKQYIRSDPPTKDYLSKLIIELLEYQEAQRAFERIVNCHTDCTCSSKEDLSKEITVIVEEIIKSKIRDNILMSSRTSLTTQIDVKSEKKIEKQAAELLILKSQVASQAGSIVNQAKYLNNLSEKVDKSNEHVECLKSQNDALKQKFDEISRENEDLKLELEIFKRENVKLLDQNDRLHAKLDELLTVE